MSQPTPGMNLYGAVDLSALAQRPQNGGQPGQAGQTGQSAGGSDELVVSVTEATFGDVIQRSTQVPVLVNLTSSRSDASAQLTAVLEKLTREYAGKFQLANVDADTNPQIAQAFQVQAVPTVVALLGGRPAPLFHGTYPEDQLRQVLDEVLKLAQQAGVTGTLQPAEDGDEETAEPPEQPLPPLHAEAVAAIERGDLAAAEDAYTRALKENPGDSEAHAALLQVQLLRRVDSSDQAQVLAAAESAAPGDVDAQLAAADVEATMNRFGDAFQRLLAAVRATGGDERERVRARLVELFASAGPSHPDVGPARRELASALY